MLAGYHDARFEYATSTCVDAAQTILRQIKILSDLNAPTSGVWFLSRRESMTLLALLHLCLLAD